MCRPSSFVTCNLATIYIRWKEKKKKEEEKKKRTKNDGYNRRVNLLGKLGIIKNDNAIIDEFAIASRQATRRLKDRFEAIIFSLIRDYQKRELSGFIEKKKKKNLTNLAIRKSCNEREDVLQGRRYYGNLWSIGCERKYLRRKFTIDSNENIARTFLKIFGRHLTRLCAWSRTKMIDHCNGRKDVLQGSPLLWKVMVYRCEWGNDWNIIWERF